MHACPLIPKNHPRYYGEEKGAPAAGEDLALPQSTCGGMGDAAPAGERDPPPAQPGAGGLKAEYARLLGVASMERSAPNGPSPRALRLCSSTWKAVRASGSPHLARLGFGPGLSSRGELEASPPAHVSQLLEWAASWVEGRRRCRQPAARSIWPQGTVHPPDCLCWGACKKVPDLGPITVQVEDGGRRGGMNITIPKKAFNPKFYPLLRRINATCSCTRGQGKRLCGAAVPLRLPTLPLCNFVVWGGGHQPGHSTFACSAR